MGSTSVSNVRLGGHAGRRDRWAFPWRIGDISGVPVLTEGSSYDALFPRHGSLTWRRLQFSSEGEFLFAVDDTAESFFYNWSELSLAPAAWWRVGLATQRTHTYASDREVQRGLLVGFTYRALDSAVYVFNPDDSQPTVVVSVSVGF